MRINCISCGHRFEMDQSYDDYRGLVKCPICRSLLQISTEEGKVKSVELPAQGVVGCATAAEASAKQRVA